MLRIMLIISATALTAINAPLAYANYRAGDLSIAFNHLLFASIGIGFLVADYRNGGSSSPDEEILEIESRIDDDLRPAVRFVANNDELFTVLDDHSEDDLYGIAAEYYDVREDRLRMAVEGLRADLETFARTGEVPEAKPTDDGSSWNDNSL